MAAPAPPAATRSARALDLIERIGNKLPEPAVLFVLLAAFVVVLSAVGAAAGWSVAPVRPDGAGGLVPAGAPVEPRSLLTADGVYWMLSSMLRNFTTLPALGLIFVAMLGIGLAERAGFFSALMRALALRTPPGLLTPAVVLLGANASVASDAGYVILPPLAAALYHAVGRHPVAGLAAAFAGVAGGFGAGFLPTGGDAALAGFAQDAARVLDPTYTVTVLHNLYFKAGSAIVVMFAGWFVTDRIVEPRLMQARTADEVDDAATVGAMALEPQERRALRWALVGQAAVVGVVLLLVLVPGMPLHGPGQPTLADSRVLVHQPAVVGPPVGAAGSPADTSAAYDVLAREPLAVVAAPERARLVESPGARWSHVIVPLIFLAFLVPGLIYGRLANTMRGQAGFVDGLTSGIRSIVPVLVIAFFLAQFVAYLGYTHLDRMMAYAGGALLVQASLPVPVLLVLFVLLVVVGDFAISGMLSKFGALAPIFIPMFMMVGISPELTTAAYRIGDSVVNVVTPLNSYLLVILAVLQKYRAGAGLGSLIALMLPYSLFFGIVWTLFLLLWVALGLPLGPGA